MKIKIPNINFRFLGAVNADPSYRAMGQLRAGAIFVAYNSGFPAAIHRYPSYADRLRTPVDSPAVKYCTIRTPFIVVSIR